ncbi:MAG: plastocyanin/azurin family copper-binding protein, partial [Akkermansiaceae bacterium]
RLYMNFEKEHIQPLADYGGGSGCGGVYISEPGFPAEWNNAPFTIDWGRAGSYRHTVEPDGATFKETAEPQRFIKMTRPTDATVDGMSAVYQASWKGPATFGWAGPDQGYIVRVTPKGHTPEPLPNLEKMTDEELVAALDSPSHIRRLAVQRTILKRPEVEYTNEQLLKLAANKTKALEVRIAALFAVSQRGVEGAKSLKTVLQILEHLANDDDLAPFFTRTYGDMALDYITEGKPSPLNHEFFGWGMELKDPVRVREAIVSAARQNKTDCDGMIANHLSSKDPVIRHTAYRALAKMSAHEAAFSKIDSDDIDTRKAAAWALMRMHKVEVVNELFSRLATEKEFPKRRPLISVLARLYHKEAEWKGNSWGTRPDTRGPYYELATWEQSERILSTLKSLLETASAEEAGFIVEKLNKNRIQDNSALKRVIELATKDDKLIPAAITQIAAASDVPPEALPIVLKGARTLESGPAVHADAVKILMKSDHADAIPAAIAALNFIDGVKGAGKQATAARGYFLKAPKLENHHLVLEKIAAEKPDSVEGRWSAMAVLELASRKKGSPESREMSLKAIEKAWPDSAQKINYINAARDLRNAVINDRIKAATTDPDSKVATAAKDAARKLKIPLPKGDNVVIVQIKAIPGQLRFDQTRIPAKPGQKIQITLSNPDKMAHNLVVVQPGRDKEVAKAAVALGAEGFAKDWLPDHPDIIAATKMLNENEEDTIEITITTRGKYPFICTFPGHENTMLGVIVVK